MSDINSITVTGRLTRDPELRQAGGSQVCRFAVACGRQWTNKATGNREERTTFFDCEVWGARGESLSRILRKGMQVTVSGSHESDTREAQDGTRRTYWTLKVSEVVLPPRNAQDAQGGAYGPGAGYQPTAPVYDQDIPF